VGALEQERNVTDAVMAIVIVINLFIGVDNYRLRLYFLISEDISGSRLPRKV
jgi:hypothetical protein